MNINIKNINVVVIKPGEIVAYEGRKFYHSMTDTVMLRCSIDVDDCKITISGRELTYVDGVMEDMDGMSGKDINRIYHRSCEIRPCPRIESIFRRRIVRDWSFPRRILRLRKSVRVTRVLSLNNYQLKIYRDELDNN